MIYTDNPIRDAETYYEKLEQAVAELPKCDYCGSPIDDHYYEINRDIVCESCLTEYFLRYV